MGDNAVHNGTIIINFIVGRRRENSSVAFGKAAAGNDFWECISSGAMPAKAAKRQASSETSVSGSTQTALS